LSFLSKKNILLLAFVAEIIEAIEHSATKDSDFERIEGLIFRLPPWLNLKAHHPACPA